MLDGSHTEAEEEASGEAEQVDEATEAKRQLLVKAAPLAGVWGLDRFGLAEVSVLKLIEALQGEQDICEGQMCTVPPRVQKHCIFHACRCNRV